MIITLSQCKSLLGISGTSKDALISALIPEAESKYLQIRNIPFTQIKGNIVASDKTISNISLYPFTNVGYITYSNNSTVSFLNRMEYLYNSTNSIDNYITDLDVINNTIEIDTASSATANDVIFTVYPQGAKYTAAKMIKYLMDKNSMSGLASESVGSYSWSGSSEGSPFGIPSDIFKSIKRYVDA